MRKLIKLPSLQNCVVGSTCTLQLPLNLTYDMIYLVISDMTMAEMTNIQVRLNGKTVQEFASGTILDNINKYYARPAFASTVLPIYFMRPEMYLPAEQRITSIGTLDVSTFNIQFDIAAGAAGVAVEAYAQVSQPQNMGVITKVRRHPLAAAAGGVQEISTIPKLGSIGAMHVVKTDCTNVDVKLDGNIVYELPKTVGEQVQKGKGLKARVPITASITHIDFMLDGMLQDAMPTKDVQDFSIRPTVTAAGSYELIVEYLAGFNEG